MQHRARTLAPEHFHLLAHLATVERQTGLPLRVTWLGLHTCADREGRFPWHPRELKLRILPNDHEVDFEEVLHHLAACGFLVHYRATRALEGGVSARVAQVDQFGQLLSWNPHQVLNTRESASAIPGAADSGSETIPHEGAFHKSTRSTTKAPEKKEEEEPEQQQSIWHDAPGAPRPRVPSSQLLPKAVVALIDLWNAETHGSGLKPCRAVTGQRRRDLELALKDEPSLEVWRGAIRALVAYPHANGQNDRGWRADIGFMVQPSQRSKWLEAGYAAAGKPGQASSVQDLLGEIDAEANEARDFERWLGALVNLPPGYRGADPRMVGSLSPAQVARAERELKTWWREHERRPR